MLPAGLTTRALTPDDLHAVFEVHHADELSFLDEPNVEVADVQSFWQRPSFDLATSSIGVCDGDRLIAYAELDSPDRGRAAVHPSSHRRGIGTWLANWLAALSHERGAERVGMPVFEGGPGDRLLAGLGWEVRWTSWVLELPAGTNVPARTVPGFEIREATPTEWPALHRVIDDAFLEWADRESEAYADFVGEVIERPGFEPWQLRVAVDGSGTVVGGAVLMMALDRSGVPIDGYVDMLGVRRDQRGQGLAQALLADAFAAAFAHGAPRGSLSTDSRTGALGLYEKVGMSVVQTWLHRASPPR
ncbi:MAG: GNAT family N-acetyltransferase [Myxococcales bacterium]|nr:MAG: GNAT family N-acetyltransferase [Myxococcales bacterium]